MANSAARQQDDSTAHASKLVDETFVFDSVQVLRTGGPGRPRLLFGTDFPFGGLPGIEANAEALAAHPRVDDELLRANTEELFARLRRP